MIVESRPNRKNEASSKPQYDGCELPEGWISAPLAQLSNDISYGYTAKSTANAVGPRLLRITDIQDGGVNWDTVPFCEIEDNKVANYRLASGDLVFARTGATTGKSYLIRNSPNAVFASYLIRVQPSPALLPEFVAAFFQTRDYWEQISENLSGSAQPNCNASKLASLSVPVAPLAEQRRIVSKLELLLGKVSSSQQRLSRVPGLLKRFRQSVLAAACSGKLTADWREENSHSDSADSLRQKVGRLRRTAWKVQRELKGQSARDADYPSPSLPSDEFDFEHPEGWIRCSMDELTSIITSGSRDWKQYYRVDGFGTFIMAQNIRPLFLDRSYRLAVAPPENDRDRVRSEVREGDLLVTIVGANTGDVCRVPEPLDQHYVCQSVALMRPVVLETAKFLELSLNSSGHGLAQYRKWIYGEGRPHLSFDNLRETAILLPPLNEQQEIVRRVEKLFAFADQIEARLKQAQTHVDRLTQSLLSKAFRGELVPTEAELARRENRDYEPASALLERIRTEKPVEASPDAARTRRRRK